MCPSLTDPLLCYEAQMLLETPGADSRGDESNDELENSDEGCFSSSRHFSCYSTRALYHRAHIRIESSYISTYGGQCEDTR